MKAERCSRLAVKRNPSSTQSDGNASCPIQRNTSQCLTVHILPNVINTTIMIITGSIILVRRSICEIKFITIACWEMIFKSVYLQRQSEVCLLYRAVSISLYMITLI